MYILCSTFDFKLKAMRKVNFSREQDGTDEQFISPDVDVAAILKELRSGEKGFVVVPAVFPPEEIAEARERILALIDSQGEKATHFQVSQAKALIGSVRVSSGHEELLHDPNLT